MPATRPTSRSTRLRDKPGLGSFIHDKLACRACGYDLRGLQFGMQCPECGVVISVSSGKGGRYAGLGHAPQSYLAWLTLGLLCLGVSVPIDFMAGMSIGSGSKRAALFLAAGGVLWFAGVMLVCQARPREPDEYIGPWETRFRHLAMLLGLSGFLGTLAEATGSLTNAGSMLEEALAWCSVILQFIGALGFFPLAVHLANLADWGSDTGLGNRLRGVAWCLAAGGVLVVFNVASMLVVGSQGQGIGGAIGGLFGLLGLFGGAIFFGAQVVLIFSIMQMLSIVGWAKRNAGEELERDRRLTEKRREHAEEMVRVSARAAGPDTSDFLTASDGVPTEADDPPSAPRQSAHQPTPEELMGRELDPYRLEGN